MRLTGILRSWDEERGFGFIAPTQGGAELFVHVSAFRRDGSQPVAGETLTFDLGRGRDGRPQAVNVVRTAVGADARPRRVLPDAMAPPRQRASGQVGSGLSTWLVRGATVMLLIVAGRWGLQTFQAHKHRVELEHQQPAIVAAPDSTPASARYRCDGRTQCTQMTSCEEATWFINHCPGTAMDGNHDGVPCEQQWCTGLR